MSIIKTSPLRRSTSVGMRLQQWAVMAFALLAILTSVHSTSTSNEDVVQTQQHSLPADDADRQLSPPRRLATPTTSPTVIIIETPEDDPYTFTGMPATLKAGTYTFKYINNSDVGHNFKIRGAGGFRKTPVCSKCTYSMTVTLKRDVNGVLAPNRQYVCEPHASSMKGIVKITA